jgi:hypothetical protein
MDVDRVLNPTFISTFYPGDVNGDAKIDLQDVIMATQITAGIIPTVPVYIAADANSDSRIGLPEALQALQVAAGLKPHP